MNWSFREDRSCVGGSKEEAAEPLRVKRLSDPDRDEEKFTQSLRGESMTSEDTEQAKGERLRWSCSRVSSDYPLWRRQCHKRTLKN